MMGTVPLGIGLTAERLATTNLIPAVKRVLSVAGGGAVHGAFMSAEERKGLVDGLMSIPETALGFALFDMGAQSLGAMASGTLKYLLRDTLYDRTLKDISARIEDGTATDDEILSATELAQEKGRMLQENPELLQDAGVRAVFDKYIADHPEHEAQIRAALRPKLQAEPGDGSIITGQPPAEGTAQPSQGLQ